MSRPNTPTRHSLLQIATLLCIALCSNPAHGAPKPRIGFLLPPDTPHSQSLHLATTLAATLPLPNSAPTAELIIRGRSGQWGDDGTEAARLALDDEACGLITPPDGTASHLVLQVAGRTGITTISLCPDTSVIGAGIPWHLQITPDNEQQALTILQGIRNHHPPPWIAIIPEGRAGREISNDLARAAATIHHPTPDVLTAPAKATDPAILIRQALHSSPTTILLWLEAERASEMTHLLRRNGYKGILAGPLHLQSRAFTSSAGPDAAGFLIPAWTSPIPSGLHNFADLYEKQAGSFPDPASLLAADAVILLRTLTPPPPTPGPLQIPQNLTGLSGPLQFDADGRRKLPLTLLHFTNGVWSLK